MPIYPESFPALVLVFTPNENCSTNDQTNKSGRHSPPPALTGVSVLRMESGSNTGTSFCGHSYYYSRRSQPIYHVLSSSILVISMQLASEMDFESPCKISATSSASHVQVSTVAPKGGALEASDT
ncbi:uncharacterized protein PADG_11210 [Paracoccidioides brasiliensis Pb18]|uniref:Uncharacterized protein n=2 Tax=Paracoccidioides brasiliensis TaxID=121759 RepID=A0A0A0HW29_PARBD|nr:uncharacterized protein PADG_11210 [Paracoccidioides brasiliensis Pb18]KGM92752.1 hypothetical protein PADG_11210 [Paracoccidioides brasiliensis Pb18]ODH15476.1 hypothetical protein ACO22_06440 [Paracoccidioides brasiliensis]ODH47542.1 hypothetical protein GX48_06348 [Paracoccidioides brasiliensis]